MSFPGFLGANSCLLRSCLDVQYCRHTTCIQRSTPTGHWNWGLDFATNNLGSATCRAFARPNHSHCTSYIPRHACALQNPMRMPGNTHHLIVNDDPSCVRAETIYTGVRAPLAPCSLGTVADLSRVCMHRKNVLSQRSCCHSSEKLRHQTRTHTTNAIPVDGFTADSRGF